MVNARGIARLGMLAVGLGIAAVAATPGIAAADTPADPVSFSSINLGDLFPAADAAPSSALDLDISVNGHTLLDLGTGATATSGTGDVAIAFGSGGTATAEGGFGDFALADSTGSGGATATAGDTLSGATGNNFDFVSATGNGSEGLAGDEGEPDTTGSSFDFASASGGGGLGDPSVAIAGDNGSGDIANTVGQNVESLSGVSDNAAAPANFDFASVIGNLSSATTTTIEASAGGGDFLSAVGGSNDTAFVIDPWGTVGSTAFAGLGNNFDLAGVFGDDLNAAATGANFLVDILPSL